MNREQMKFACERENTKILHYVEVRRGVCEWVQITVQEALDIISECDDVGFGVLDGQLVEGVNGERIMENHTVFIE